MHPYPETNKAHFLCSCKDLPFANSLQAPTDIDLKTLPLGLKDIGLIHTFNKIILVVAWIHSGVTYMLAMVIK